MNYELVFTERSDQQLLELENNPEEIVIITKNGKPLIPRHLQEVFARAGKKAGIPFNVTPYIANHHGNLPQKGRVCRL